MLLFGFPSESEDLDHHLRLTINYFNSLNQGIFVPNWTSAENFGSGSIAVRFYPPIAQFVMAVFRILMGNWQTAFIAAFFFWSCVGGFGVYLFSNDIFKNRLQSTVAAVLFILAHYHVNQLYNTFLFSEFVALSILPFCLLYAKKVCEKGTFYDVLKFGISIALLILSNLPLTIIGAISVGIFVLFLLEKDTSTRQIGKLAAGCLTGLLLSSFFWWRILFEVKWLNIYQPNTDPQYDFRNNFVIVIFEFDERGLWFLSGMFALLVLFLAVSLIVSGTLKSLFENKVIGGISTMFAVSTFMMFSISTPIWENIVFLQRVQFPRRFFAVVSLCTAILIGFCFGFVKRENWIAKRPLILILIGMSMIYCFISVRQVAMGAMFIDGAKFDSIIEINKTAEVLPHWQPVWMTSEGIKRKNRFAAKEREIRIIEWENEYRKISVGEGEKTKAEIALLSYPHWKTFINGAEIQSEKSSDGTMFVELPAESCEIELKFIEPQSSLISRKLSLAAWSFCFAAFIFRRLKKTE